MMMGMLQTLGQWIRELWPLAIVEQWETGVYYVFGRYLGCVGPGIYPVLPWFTTLRTVTTVPSILQTERVDLTLDDGVAISFVATATVRVVDAARALNAVDNYHQTTLALLNSVLSDRIARVDVDRVAAPKRARLLSDLTRWANEEAMAYGVEVAKVRFTSFVERPRMYRLLSDAGAVVTDW